MSLLHKGEIFATVEIDPPRGVILKEAVEGARRVVEAGAVCLNVPDNSLASIRMDNVVFAQLLRERVEVPIILHMSCRDKNLIALQSELLGAQAANIEALLAVTGDP